MVSLIGVMHRTPAYAEDTAVWLWWLEASWEGFLLPVPSVVASAVATIYDALPRALSSFLETMVAPAADGSLALLRGAGVGALIERWIHTAGIEVPFIIIPRTFLGDICAFTVVLTLVLSMPACYQPAPSTGRRLPMLRGRHCGRQCHGRCACRPMGNDVLRPGDGGRAVEK